MINVNSPEICWLIFTIIMTALFWVPQIINSIFQAGLKKAFFYPDEAANYYSEWANRSRAAHKNAVENLVIFAPLVLLVLMLDISNDLTGIASMVYFVTRCFHYIMHVLAVPLMRTVGFLVGFICQLIMGISILNTL